MRSYRMLLCAGCLLLAASIFVGVEGGDPKDAKKDKSPSRAELPKTEEKLPEPKKPSHDEEVLRRAEIGTDAESVLKFFQKRTLPEAERSALEKLVRQLASSDYRTRAKATAELTGRGVAALEVLRSPPPSGFHLETARRIEQAIQHILDNDVAPEVPAAAVRVLAERKPAALVETLLAYLPFADNDVVLDEIRTAVTAHASSAGKPHPAVLAALSDRAAIRRATAAEALGKAAYAANKQLLRKLLADPDALVRYRVAQTLAYARERDAIPILIQTIPDLPLNVAWQSEDFLLRLAASASPPSIAMGNDRKTRERCRDAWQAWWKKQESKIDLAKLEETPKQLGYTLIVLLDQGRIVELGRDNLPRWEIKGLVFPLDAQMIDEERVIVAEYHANRVTERNLRGEVLWKKDVVGPLVAQRLPNGNTFIANDHQLLEYDKDDREVMNITLPDEGRQIMKAMKLPNGEIACMLVDSRVVRLDAKGQELHSFNISIGMRLFGGRVHMLPTGRVLVPHNAEGKVTEYDAKGKIVWEVPFEQPIAAVRLPNGNTMITSMNPAVGAVEIDRVGNEVWSHRSATRVTRALRR